MMADINNNETIQCPSCKTSITVDATKAIQAIATITKSVPEAFEAALKRAAEEFIQIAQSAVPADTGNLRSYIGIRQEGENFVIVGPDPDQAPYCEFVEMGTSRMIAQPYTGSTADQMESRFSIILAEEINKRIR